MVFVVVVVVVDHEVDSYFLAGCSRCWSHVNYASLTSVFGIQIHNGRTLCSSYNGLRVAGDCSK